MSTEAEREFQISLAEASADVQTYLSIALGLSGMLFAYLIGLEQIYFSLPSKSDVVALFTLFSLAVGVVLFMIYIRIFFGKADKARNKISELRKKYTKQKERG
jgi:vacuolar-type H+-ATPase subunit I/STV1